MPLSILIGRRQAEKPDRTDPPATDTPVHSVAGVKNCPRFIRTQDTRCIVDTGASDHIISRKHLTQKERKNIRELESGPSFQTPNKETFSNEVVDFQVKDLAITVTAWVLEDSPPLISLGKLIEDHNAEYTWTKEQGPIIRIRNRVVQCSVKQRCPFVAAS